MDLVRLMHVMDMPSSGKHDFNYLCSLLILTHLESVLCDTVQFILIFFLCTIAMCTQCP